jgi:HEAT repeat protein
MREMGLSRVEDALEAAERRDLDEATRARALFVLQAFPERTYVERVLAILRAAETAGLSLEAAKVLSALASRRATKPLVRTIRETRKEHVAFACVYALWFLHDRRSALTLQWVVGQPRFEARTRGMAAEALGMFLGALSFLLGLADHPIPKVRVGALFGVGMITGDAGIRGRFRPLLDDQAVIGGGQRVSEVAARFFAGEEEVGADLVA